MRYRSLSGDGVWGWPSGCRSWRELAGPGWLPIDTERRRLYAEKVKMRSRE